MKASAITAKINRVATKYGPLETRKVYKRTLLESAGNTLIDRGVTQVLVDVLFSPQPLFKRASASPSQAPPPSSNRRDVIAGTNILVPDDYEFIFTPAQMSTADVSSKYNIIVLKDGAGNEEQLQIISYKPLVLTGVEIATSALYRSVSGGASSGVPVYSGGPVIRYSLTPAPNGVLVAFTAPITISANTLVVRNGMILTAVSDYSYSGMTVTFVIAPLVSDNLAVYQ